MDVKDIISDYLVVFVAQIAAGKVDNTTLFNLGEKFGRVTTDKCREQLGENWNNLENVIQEKVDNFMAGYYQGLNSDDEAIRA